MRTENRTRDLSGQQTLIDPTCTRYQHFGRLIQVLTVNDEGDCWKSYVDGTLKIVSKELVHAVDQD